MISGGRLGRLLPVVERIGKSREPRPQAFVLALAAVRPAALLALLLALPLALSLPAVVPLPAVLTHSSSFPAFPACRFRPFENRLVRKFIGRSSAKSEAGRSLEIWRIGGRENRKLGWTGTAFMTRRNVRLAAPSVKTDRRSQTTSLAPPVLRLPTRMRWDEAACSSPVS